MNEDLKNEIKQFLDYKVTLKPDNNEHKELIKECRIILTNNECNDLQMAIDALDDQKTVIRTCHENRIKLIILRKIIHIRMFNHKCSVLFPEKKSGFDLGGEDYILF